MTCVPKAELDLVILVEVMKISSKEEQELILKSVRKEHNLHSCALLDELE